MADNDGTITIGIELDDGTIKKAAVNINELGQKLGDDFGKRVSGGIDKSFTGIAIQFQAIAKVASKAFDVVANVVGKAVDEAIGAEQALVRFNATLANMGKFSKEASLDFQDFAKNLQNVGTVSDDAVIDAATSLISIGKLSGESLKQASQASVNLAAGLGTDLNSAFDLVAKAAAGNTAALGRYGIKVDESIPKSERFAAVLTTIQDRFGGLDVARANTFGGALTQLSNAFNDIFENIGNLITNSPTLVAVIKFVSEKFRELSGSIDKFGKQGDVFKPIVDGAIQFARVINLIFLPLEKIGQIGKFVFEEIRFGIQQSVAAVGKLGAGIGNVLSSIGVISDEANQNLQTFADSSQEVMLQFVANTREAGAAIISGLSITAPVDLFLTDLQRAVDTAAPLTDQIKNNFKATGDAVVSSMALTAKQLAGLVNNALVNVVSQAVQGLVTNIAKGKNAFQGLLKTIGGIFGDMLIQIGTTVLLAGIGMEAIRASIVGLTGGPAIFAGIALIAAGALLKALSGGGGGEQPTTVQPAGAGGVPGSPDVGGIGEQPEQDRNRKTEVAINIQGNVLDRKETGLEIANVLQEYFDTQDGVLARG